MSVELWKQFSLGESRNPDPGGGIMYALRYPYQVLQEKSQQIAIVLDGIKGLNIQEIDEALRVDMTGVQRETIARVYVLIEEQSILTDALEYRQFFDKMGISSIAGLRNYVLSLLASLNNENKVDLYNTVDMGIRGIIKKIKLADNQNNILTAQQRKELQELQDACNRFVKIAGGRTVIVG